MIPSWQSIAACRLIASKNREMSTSGLLLFGRLINTDGPNLGNSSPAEIYDLRGMLPFVVAGIQVVAIGDRNAGISNAGLPE